MIPWHIRYHLSVAFSDGSLSLLLYTACCFLNIKIECSETIVSTSFTVHLSVLAALD